MLYWYIFAVYCVLRCPLNNAYLGVHSSTYTLPKFGSSNRSTYVPCNPLTTLNIVRTGTNRWCSSTGIQSTPWDITAKEAPNSSSRLCRSWFWCTCVGPDLHVDASDSTVCVVSCGVYSDNTYIVIIIHILYIGMWWVWHDRGLRLSSVLQAVCPWWWKLHQRRRALHQVHCGYLPHIPSLKTVQIKNPTNHSITNHQLLLIMLITY